MKMKLALGMLALLGLIGRAPAADDPKTLAAQARQILKTHCYRCHSGDGSSSGYGFDVTRHETLVKGVGEEPALITPNSTSKSPLWDAIQKRMPQKGSPERESFGDEQRKILEKWIVAGAPEFPTTTARPFRSIKAELTAVRDHLAKARPADRPFLRFFTLANQHNDARLSEEDLRYARAALSKVLNSLSWKARIMVPAAVDESGTLYAIDVRHLDWDRDDLWRKLIDAYPYGLKYGSHPDTALRDLDAELVRSAACDLPVIRADWFIATASRPPLYHDLLRLPKTAGELERQLGVDVADNFRKDKLARAGFQKSGVSGQNRLVERHESLYGAYWKSHDFLPTNGRANLTRFPLGPIDLITAANLPYLGQAFRQDGGELIFNLPNGMQGYMLVNGKDERIDIGPIDVVSDDKRVSGTPAIVNAVSCMACHQHGMISFKDQIRDHSAVFGEAEEKVKRLYLEPKKFDALVEVDRARFLTGLDKAIGPFLKIGADKDTPITKFKEPVAEVAISYRRGYLDLKTVASELYLEDPDELLKKIGERRLKELGLEALARGGVVGRLEWEAVDTASLMQETARALRFTPFGK